MERFYPIEEITIDARAKNWAIFTPDWEYLSNYPTLSLASLTGLSVGLHPWFSHPAWVFRCAIPYFEGERDPDFDAQSNEEDAEKVKRLKEFLRRIHIAVGNLAPLGGMVAADGVIQGEATLIKVSDFIVFADLKDWDLPEEFSRFPSTSTNLKPEASIGSANRERTNQLPVATKAEAVKTWKDDARAIGEEWMNAERKEGRSPGVIAIARHVEGELSSRNIPGVRGRFLDWETIKKEALKGITGKLPNGKRQKS